MTDIDTIREPTLGYSHVRKEDLHARSARDVNPPFAAFDVVHRRDYEDVCAELAKLVLAHDAHVRDGWCPICDPDMASFVEKDTPPPEPRPYGWSATDHARWWIVQPECGETSRAHIEALLDALAEKDAPPPAPPQADKPRHFAEFGEAVDLAEGLIALFQCDDMAALAEQAWQLHDELARTLRAASAQPDTLRAALEFYAAPASWTEGAPDEGRFDGVIPTCEDKGARARAALAVAVPVDALPETDTPPCEHDPHKCGAEECLEQGCRYGAQPDRQETNER